MKRVNGKLVPDNHVEAKELVSVMRQTANNKLDWREKTKNPAVQDNLTEAAVDLLDKAEKIAEEWGMGSI